MNNQNNRNNRRRGRGNRNQSGGNGSQLNRIDSRARGNAPQMLDKFKKLAQDAQHHGDRVQMEYYLQFADHYFRVIADSRVRVDEQRQRQPGDRWGEQEAEDEAMEFGMDADFAAFDRPHNRRDEPRENREPREAREPRENSEPRENREPREPRVPREPREPQRPRFEPAAEANSAAPVLADVGEPAGETSDNPFVREPRSQRGLRPRGERRARREADEAPAAALDPAILPPAIGIRPSAEPEAEQIAPETEASAPKRRGRPRKNPLPEATPEAAEG